MRPSPPIRRFCGGSALVALTLLASCRARHHVELVDATSAPDATTDVATTDAARRDAEANDTPAQDTFIELDNASEHVSSNDDGVALVLSRGTAHVTIPWNTPTALRIDTPSGRVIVSSGEARIAVADDGTLRVHALAGAVTVWPAPSMAPLHDTPRPLRATPLDAGIALVCTVGGGACTSSRGAHDPDATVAWLARRNRDAARHTAAARDALAHAASDNETDARAALTQLRSNVATTRARDSSMAARSLALGRLHACVQRLIAAGADDATERQRRYAALRDDAIVR